MKKTVAIFSVSLLLILSGVILVLTHKDAVGNTLVALGFQKEIFPQADTSPYLQKLQNEIPVLKILPKKNGKREIWEVGQGVSLPNYLLRAQKHLNQSGGKVLHMEEKPSASDADVALLDFLAPFGDTFQVAIQVADSFYDNTSQLAVGFSAGENWRNFFPKLQALDYPYTLLVTPGEKPGKRSQKPEKIQEPVLWLPMEDKKLQFKKQTKSMIFVHQSDSEIQEQIESLLENLPNAQGVASKWGSRAVEQQALLRAVFAPLKKKGFWFLDLTGNRYSKTLEVCKEMKLKCRSISPFDPAHQTHANYVENILKLTKRSGNGILILPLSEASLKAVEDLERQANAQGTEIVNLSRIFKSE